MDTNEQLARNANIIGRNQHLENLLSNDDFLRWKEDTVEARMASIVEAIKTVDRSRQDWRDKVCDAVIAYQECRVVYEAVFSIAQTASTLARSQLQELSSAQNQSPSADSGL